MSSKEELYQEGMEAMANGNMQLAIEGLKAAINVDAQYGDALQALAMVYYQSNQYDEAIAVGKEFVKARPDDILAHTSLSMFYVAKGMVPEAEAEAAVARQLTWREQLKEGKGPS